MFKTADKVFGFCAFIYFFFALLSRALPWVNVRGTIENVQVLWCRSLPMAVFNVKLNDILMQLEIACSSLLYEKLLAISYFMYFYII